MTIVGWFGLLLLSGSVGMALSTLLLEYSEQDGIRATYIELIMTIVVFSLGLFLLTIGIT